VDRFNEFELVRAATGLEGLSAEEARQLSCWKPKLLGSLLTEAARPRYDEAAKIAAADEGC
jgi:hypothetical protein